MIEILAALIVGAIVFAAGLGVGCLMWRAHIIGGVRNLRDDYSRYPDNDAERKGRFDALCEAVRCV